MVASPHRISRLPVSPSHERSDRAAHRHRSRLRHDGRPACRQAHCEHDGHTYYFCSEGCRTKFAKDPDRYLTRGEPEPLPQGTLYTCPMHPQIVQEGPGPCPICGMALEPMGAPPEDADNPELIDFTRRLRRSPCRSRWRCSRSTWAAMCSASICSRSCRRPPSNGSSSPSPCPWCCGAAGRSSSAASSRSAPAGSTCSR